MAAVPASWQEYLAGPAGIADAAWQREVFARAAAAVSGIRAVQLGLPEINALERSAIAFRILAVPGIAILAEDDLRLQVLADESALPLESGCADLVAWPHGPGRAADMTAALAEIERVLAPNGVVMLSFFNASGAWNLKRKLLPSRSPVPAGSRPQGTAAVVRALKNAGLAPEGGVFGVYGTGAKEKAGTGWVEKAGDRWWPTFSNLVLLTARKKSAGMTLVGRASFAPAEASGRAAAAGSLPRVAAERSAAAGEIAITAGERNTP